MTLPTKIRIRDSAASSAQGHDDAVYDPRRIPEEVYGRDDNEVPPLALEFLSPHQIGTPLTLAIDVMSPRHTRSPP
ncbi:hypothetical protein GCM10011492_32680 [Flexivirga endophytica]|uniref:Uncharacterized protein n=1 Tax=Flexivirga endophytica TaxID=1849103 RepID=A0A916TCZ5_9MICO|nr:hypothetical protein [Flexivirga endophytica]GGB39364.1 hypothetical protein GCM10011492_32680 [Flexivirga endophytica]GHB47280.1 hypothetical protein GCM10008112_15070 [Flexivirga endophytica]